MPQLVELDPTMGTFRRVERPGNRVTPEEEFSCMSTIAMDHERRHLITTGVRSDTIALYSMSTIAIDRERRHLITTGVRSDTLALYSMSKMSLFSSGSVGFAFKVLNKSS